MSPQNTAIRASFEAARDQALLAADPHAALIQAWTPSHGRVWVLSIGKAALAMASAAQSQILTDHASLAGGLILCPAPLNQGVAATHLTSQGLEILPCDHPLPTPRNMLAAQRVADWASAIPSADLLIVCLSGGGSAYLTSPAPGVSLEPLTLLTQSLQQAGATIHELNAVRKHAEQLKGGRLGKLCPARVRVYVLSDVLGDAFDTIASGPFHPDPTTFAQCLAVLVAHSAEDIAPCITTLFQSGAQGDTPETPKSWRDLGREDRISHKVIANNDAAIDGACQALTQLGTTVLEVRRRVEGHAAELGMALAHTMLRSPPHPGPRAWVWGGEWVVNATATPGVGGPSQELALAWASVAAGANNLHLMTFSTDGIDGPTPAAGAIVSGDTAALLAHAGVDIHAALAAHDSHHALARIDALLHTGPTGTNVNHILVALAE